LEEVKEKEYFVAHKDLEVEAKIDSLRKSIE